MSDLLLLAVIAATCSVGTVSGSCELVSGV